MSETEVEVEDYEEVIGMNADSFKEPTLNQNVTSLTPQNRPILRSSNLSLAGDLQESIPKVVIWPWVTLKGGTQRAEFSGGLCMYACAVWRRTTKFGTITRETGRGVSQVPISRKEGSQCPTVFGPCLRPFGIIIITIIIIIKHVLWLRWHSHVKDIAGAPHNH